MIPARTAKRHGEEAKLLVLSEREQIHHAKARDLPDYFQAGDLLIVNRSATLPASFRGYVRSGGQPIEIRLAAFQGPHPAHLENWLAFSFGAGDWTMPTEIRGQPPNVKAGNEIVFGEDLSARIIKSRHERLLDIRFTSSNLEQNLYRHGRPIQYSYLKEPLAVWDQQTLFSGAPISVEPPSASFQLTWELVFKLRQKGVEIADLLHGAGISSTGSADLDQLLPLTEWYDIPAATVAKFNVAKNKQRRIIAVGTTVLRALESAWDGKSLRPGAGLSALKITAASPLHTATALLTGMHEIGTSHMQILQSLCPPWQITAGYAEAEQRGYRSHEFGDIALICKKGKGDKK